MSDFNNWTASELINDAKRVIRGIRSDDVKTQLYKILSLVKRLQREFRRDGFKPDQVHLLKIDLAWAAQKHRHKLGNIYQSLEQKIDGVTKQQDFDKLINYVEALVAFNALGLGESSGGGNEYERRRKTSHR